jgi:hypothetical protein
MDWKVNPVESWKFWWAELSVLWGIISPIPRLHRATRVPRNNDPHAPPPPPGPHNPHAPPLPRTEKSTEDSTETHTYGRTIDPCTSGEGPRRHHRWSMLTPVGSTAICPCSISVSSLQHGLPPMVASWPAYGSNAGRTAASRQHQNLTGRRSAAMTSRQCFHAPVALHLYVGSNAGLSLQQPVSKRSKECRPPSCRLADQPWQQRRRAIVPGPPGNTSNVGGRL